MITEWTYLIDNPHLRVQRNPDNPNDINVDRKCWDGTYYTVKYLNGDVKFRHTNHLEVVGLYLDQTEITHGDDPFLWSTLNAVTNAILKAYRKIL